MGGRKQGAETIRTRVCVLPSRVCVFPPHLWFSFSLERLFFVIEFLSRLRRRRRRAVLREETHSHADENTPAGFRTRTCRALSR